MATTTTPATAPEAPAAEVPLAARLDLKRALRIGALGALGMAFVAANGMVESFDRRLLIEPVLSLGMAVLFGIPLIAGFIAGAARPKPGQPPRTHGPVDVLAAAIAGVVAAVGPIVIVVALDSGANLRQTFPSMSPVLRGLLTFHNEPPAGLAVLLGVTVVTAAVGGILHLVSARMRRAIILGLQWVVIFSLLELIARQVFANLGLTWLHRTMYVSNSGLRLIPALVIWILATVLAIRLVGSGAKLRQRVVSQSQAGRIRVTVLAVIVIVAMAMLPTLFGSLVNELFVNVGLFMLMALGLNIVVGYAGLLDLGYVAFFAVGAYASAVLTSPLSPAFSPELNWWLALPIVIGLATIAGLLVGTPVIRLRGDYLAIVTLGFGEIVRILFLSDWLRPTFGGAQGIQRIPGVDFGAFEVRGVDPQSMLYLTAVFVLLAAYVSWRLQESRVGRAWAAMREDETTAEVMGVDTVRAKLMAFVTGAILASFGGALFSAKVGSVFPNSFELLVSIIILVVVIVGGMGHIPGVMVGAIVLIGVLGGPTQPGLLQEFQEYKLLIYGALLVYMMLERPEGLVPSVRRSRELHQDEFMQDAWFDKKEGDAEPDEPVAAAEGRQA